MSPTRPFAVIGVSVLAMVVFACGPPAQEPAVSPAPNLWPALRDRLIEEYLEANPMFAVRAGRHEFDGRLPNLSGASIASEVARLKSARDRARAVSNEGLTAGEQLERDTLVAQIESDRFWLESAQDPFRNPAWYLSHLDPAPYLTRNYAPLETRMRAYTKYAHAVRTALPQIQANLHPPLSPPLLERGVSVFGGFAEFFEKNVPQVFREVKDTALQEEFRTANAEAAKAMRALAAWLETQREKATAPFALGADLFAKMLVETEQVNTSLADLEAAGRADLQRNQAALRDACAAYAPGRDARGCIAKMNANKPKGGVVEGARAQLAGLKAFVRDSGVATIPGPEDAQVDESPPYNRANSAYIDIPGPFEKGLPAIYYISPPDPAWTPKERQDYIPGVADLLFTSVHEVWPGHFLQFLHSNRNPSIVSRLFVGYAYAEGWAHYAEETMWEVGLGTGDLETHIGQLGNALLRNVRFLSAIGLHTKGMSVADSEQMFRGQAFTDVGTARQQAARGAYDPGYLNYTLGKLMIRKLRDDWTASRGGRAAWRDFHDAFLSNAAPTIPLVRRQMMGADGEALF